MEGTKKTQVVAGHEITLVAGQRYMASRPIIGARTEYPVSIVRLGTGTDWPAPEFVVEGLTYGQANELLKAFNNGRISFAGRIW